jgi:RNA binding exosome subunit
MLTARVAKKEMTKAIVKHLFTMLSRSERRELNLDLERSLDEENNFYTRLDKQEAVNGRVRLTREDPIRVKVRTNTWRPTVEDIRKIFMDLGMTE